MPRIYMSIAHEDRYAITEIMQQTRTYRIPASGRYSCAITMN